MKNLYFLISFIYLLTSCEKPDAHPEERDEIYQDLRQELEITSKALESEEKNLEKLTLEKENVVPQTGQIKFALKKIYETESTLTKLRQQKQFFEIKLELRKAADHEQYLKSLKTKKPWPDPEEVATYKSTLKLQREKLSWDKNKGMKKNVPRGTSAPPEKETAAKEE